MPSQVTFPDSGDAYGSLVALAAVTLEQAKRYKALGVLLVSQVTLHPQPNMPTTQYALFAKLKQPVARAACLGLALHSAAKVTEHVRRERSQSKANHLHIGWDAFPICPASSMAPKRASGLLFNVYLLFNRLWSALRGFAWMRPPQGVHAAVPGSQPLGRYGAMLDTEWRFCPLSYLICGRFGNACFGERVPLHVL